MKSAEKWKKILFDNQHRQVKSDNIIIGLAIYNFADAIDKMFAEHDNEIKQLIDFEAIEFAIKVSKAMNELKSSHVYFIMQQAFTEGDTGNIMDSNLTWEECEEMFESIISKEKTLTELKSKI